jgi:hypothetical protein
MGDMTRLSISPVRLWLMAFSIKKVSVESL